MERFGPATFVNVSKEKMTLRNVSRRVILKETGVMCTLTFLA